MLTWELGIGLLMGLAAVVEDLWRRQVSNWIPLTLLAAGFLMRTLEEGWRGFGSSLSGSALGFGIFLIFYLMGGLGGGDVKLMAAFGALLGPKGIVTAAWVAAILGALAAAGYLGWLRFRKLDRRGLSIPYAPAIVLGCWIVLGLLG
jgi:prepilin peptidase CpaA